MNDYTTRGHSPHIARAAAHRPFPHWVAGRAIPTASDFVKMSSAAFADKRQRRFPVSNPIATFYSALDAYNEIGNLAPPVLERIKQACDMFDIGSSVAPYLEFFADDLEKRAAAPDIPHALEASIDGVAVRMLPIGDAEDVREAATALLKMADERRLPYAMLMPAASAVCKAASDLGVTDLPVVLTALCRERMPLEADDPVIPALLQKRARFATSKDFTTEAVAAQFDAAVTELKDGDATPAEFVQKIAAIDLLAGINESYEYTPYRRLELPHEIVFRGPWVDEVEKFAKENALVNGVAIPLSAFANLNSAEAAFKLSKRAASAVTMIKEATDARDISLEVANWSGDDSRTLCRILVTSNP